MGLGFKNKMKEYATFLIASNNYNNPLSNDKYRLPKTYLFKLFHLCAA